MPLDVGRITHLAEQMHRSEDDAGDPIDDDFLLAADGARGLKWVDPATLVTGAPALDDLTDVIITSPALADRLRFDGMVWRNSALIWTPVTVFDPVSGNYLPAVDSGGQQIMTEA